MINTQFHKGIHIIADLWGCNPEKLSFIDEIKPVLSRVVKESGLNSLQDYFFQFEPKGVTGVYVLSQSHISIHTWPEKNFASVDIFTCGPPENAVNAFNTICNELQPKRIQKKFLERMDEKKQFETIKARNVLAAEKRNKA